MNKEITLPATFKKYLQPLNIMTYVLDDDKDMLEILEQIFKENGFDQCNFFTEGKDFIEKLNENVHVCIVDHNLNNGVSGLEVARKARELNDECYIVAMTGTHDPKVIIKYINECGVRYWVDKDKPRYMDELAVYVKKIIPAIKSRFELMSFVLKGRNELKQWAH